MISASKGAIFRKEAVQKYAQGREKNVLPRFVTPPVFLFLWCLLVLFLSAGIIAWLGRVPVYVTGIGVVLDSSSSSSTENGEMVGIIFVPYSPSLHLQPGQGVNMQIGQAGPQIRGVIQAVEPRILSPSEVRKHFLISTTDPSLAVTVSMGSHLSLYAGSLLQAQIEIGSRRLLSLFPGFNAFSSGLHSLFPGFNAFLDI